MHIAIIIIMLLTYWTFSKFVSELCWFCFEHCVVININNLYSQFHCVFN